MKLSNQIKPISYLNTHAAEVIRMSYHIFLTDDATHDLEELYGC